MDWSDLTEINAGFLVAGLGRKYFIPYQEENLKIGKKKEEKYETNARQTGRRVSWIPGYSSISVVFDAAIFEFNVNFFVSGMGVVNDTFIECRRRQVNKGVVDLW